VPLFKLTTAPRKPRWNETAQHARHSGKLMVAPEARCGKGTSRKLPALKLEAVLVNTVTVP